MIRRIRKWAKQPATTDTIIAANAFVVLSVIWGVVLIGWLS